jgi:succinate-acetate transporter protein
MFLASLRSNVALASLFFCLTLTFMFLMIGAFTIKVKITKIGGGFGILTAAIAYYTAASGLITQQASYFSLPVVDLPKRH